ncbi:MAG: PEP-CTERM sorting domain-containing protein [Opitutaceae bacterium]|jgi:hypothetical protein|nr:PEP-CTERM sorting domain-containing protein [Opitutaceae bacterium]
MKNKLRSFSIVLAAIASGAFTMTHAALTVVDNFASAAADGALLSSVSGWSTGTVNTATVSAAAGYGGSMGATVLANENYALTLTGSNVLTAADGPLEFKVHFRGATSSDNYQSSTIMLTESGGTNALAFQFNGGTGNGNSDNYIMVSSGTGGSWGSMGLATVANSAWEHERWYEVTIRFELETTGTGQSVSGFLSVLDTVTNSFLLQNVVIGGIGSGGGAFDRVDGIQIKNNGTARAFDTSNFRIGTAAVPEPATTALLVGLSVPGLVALRRRLQRKLR